MSPASQSHHRGDDSIVDERPPIENETLAQLGSARAIRRFTDAAVTDEQVRTVVWAGTRASSPNNSQLWHVVVVRDPERREQVAAAVGHFVKWIDRLPEPSSQSDARIRASARSLVAGLAAVPVLLFVCMEDRYPEAEPDARYLWSTVGACAQNMIVAARSLGLGATLTMLHVANESAIVDLLGVPAQVEVGAMIALGWPDAPHGPMRRRPVDVVMHDDRW